MKSMYLLFFLYLFFSSTTCWGKAKTDIITLHNGDHFTCAIESLYAGILKCSTDGMGTVKVQWDEIVNINSSYEFQVRYSDGSRYIGIIDRAVVIGNFILISDGKQIKRNWLNVVELRPLEKEFKEALDIYLSAGYDYTKASDSTQVNLGFELSYEVENSHSTVNLRHIISDTREESTSNTKLDLYRGYFNDRNKRKFHYGSTSYESNDQLALDYRVSVGYGIGRYFIDNYKMQFFSTIGLMANIERDLADEKKKSIELALKLKFTTWKFDSPELDLEFYLNLYPSLTDTGRLRGDADLHLRWELYNDLFLDITTWGVYDNRSSGNGDVDYGVSTGVGWNF